jgi:hypothetical protein
MKPTKTIKILFTLLYIVSFGFVSYGQQITLVANYSINQNGQVQLTVNSTAQNYYILKVRHQPTGNFELFTSMSLGKAGTTVISEQLEAYPLNHYQILAFPINSPIDTDGDSINDVLENANFPIQNPINAASPLNILDGTIAIDSLSTFNKLAESKDYVQWSEFLNGKRFVKFIITHLDSFPKVYFINGNTHNLHSDFANSIDIEYLGNNIEKGQIIYHPSVLSNNGTLGTFAFNYSNGHGRDFEIVQKTHELLAANMPFINNNLSYIITANSEDEYAQDSVYYENSRIPILMEDDVYAQVDYWSLNEAEGFGFFREMSLDETPNQKDIVLYHSIPNTLPSVGGIITSVIQTPLSHVNLRAIQDKIPNAFIRDPLIIDSIASLLNHYIYYKVEQDKFFIREASLAEVNNWYENLRPNTIQEPPLNLTYTSILPLDDITFSMSDGFGAKCANVATMLSFDFPEGTIPNGFGVPFYFYDEFMKFNNLYEQAQLLIDNPDFIADRNIRDEMLKTFRKTIKDAEMPNWMLDELAEMQQSFPQNTSIRCRSSTNNEDLPGFNGAGLYTSKTQHPDEGHISKSIQQVYASLWNLRAFDERDFYKINHFKTAMGVLCHPNYSNEIANGVGVSTDPMYQTKNTFYYLNTQIGEDLITNPDTASIPEEILLDKVSFTDSDYIVLNRSNLNPSNTLIMTDEHLDQMRAYLTVIHDNFEVLYEAYSNETFAMEIEYKITCDNQLIIKQARPWVTYLPKKYSIPTIFYDAELIVYPNPAHNYISILTPNYTLTSVTIVNLLGKQVLQKNIGSSSTKINIANISAGTYIITGFVKENNTSFSMKFVKQ